MKIVHLLGNTLKRGVGNITSWGNVAPVLVRQQTANAISILYCIETISSVIVRQQTANALSLQYE